MECTIRTNEMPTFNEFTYRMLMYLSICSSSPSVLLRSQLRSIDILCLSMIHRNGFMNGIFYNENATFTNESIITYHFYHSKCSMAYLHLRNVFTARMHYPYIQMLLEILSLFEMPSSKCMQQFGILFRHVSTLIDLDCFRYVMSDRHVNNNINVCSS